jgi:cyclin B
LGRQPNLNFLARANIVNWMVELQETFELNHETLYLGVKLFDMFIDRTPSVPARADLQLIASAAVFIASKYDVSLANFILAHFCKCNYFL